MDSITVLAHAYKILLGRLVLLVCVLASFPCFSQEFILKKRHFTEEDGIAARQINYIFEDSKGFIWISTRNGWDKFDGISFKNYNSPSHQNNTHLAEDWQGRIWIYHPRQIHGHGMAQAIGVFDPLTEKYLLLENAVDSLPFKPQEIISLSSTEGMGIVTLLLQNGQVFSYTNKGFQYEKTFDFSGTNTIHQKIFSTFKDSLAAYSITSNDDLRNMLIFQSLNNHHSHSNIVELTKVHPSLLSSSRYQFLYFANQGVFYSEDIHSKTAKPFYLDSLGQKVKVNLYPKLYLPKVASSNGLIWTTDDKGWVIYQLLQNRFSRSIKDKIARRGISKNGQTLLSLSLLPGSSKFKVGHRSIEMKTSELKGVSFIKSKLLNGYWIGGRGGLFFCDTLSNYKTTKLPCHLTTVLSLYQETTHRIWLGGRGLAYLSPQEDSVFQFTNYGLYPELKEHNIFYFHQNEQGIWLATSGGVYLLDSAKGVLRRVHYQGKKENFIPSDFIVHIYEDSDGWFWLASQGEGLIKWHPQKGLGKQYTIDNELPDNVIYEVYEDDYGYLWMGSNKGLIRFHKKKEQVQVFLEKDGVTNNEFNLQSHFQDKDGTLYFGGINGLTVFHPKDFVNLSAQWHNLSFRLTSVEKISSNGQPQSMAKEVIPHKKITLSPSDLGFTVEFALLDYINSENIEYAYKIEEIDATWSSLKTPSVRINTLPYGTYHLLLRAKQPQGKWLEPLSIEVLVLRPIYLQPWFTVMAIVLVVTTVFLAFRYRIRSLEKAEEFLKKEVAYHTAALREDKQTIEKQTKELKALDEAKSRFFTNISHELRTPLTLIISPLYSILRGKERDKIAPEFLSRLKLMERNSEQLRDLVDDILDLSKLDHDKLELQEEEIALYPCLNRITASFELLANHLSIGFQKNISISNKEEVLLLDCHKIEKVLSNLLSNAIKYTPTGKKVIFKAFTHEEKLVIQVIDNGQGIPEEDLPYIFDRFFQSKQPHSPVQGSTGIGLALSKELTLLMKGSLTVESIYGQGSTFSLSLPYKKVIERKKMPSDYDEGQKDLSKVTYDLPTQPTGSYNILIVEDISEMQLFIYSLISPYYQCFRVFNGKQALEVLAQKEIDLIISDVMMPEMDGYALLQHLRSEQAYQSIPVIMLTALNSESSKLKALSIGVDDYLLKPFMPQELLARIQNMLARYEVRKQLLNETDNRIVTALNPLIAPTEEAVIANHNDDIFIKKVENSISASLENPDFRLHGLADQFDISYRHFRRKIKQITGLTPKQYQQEIALQKARELLENRVYGNPTAVAYSIGINHVTRFSKLYKARFGRRPSEYFK